MPVSDDFAEKNGILTRRVPGFHPREAQRQMAISVTEVIDKTRCAYCRSRDRDRKTYAYLVPALRSGKKLSSLPDLRHYKINPIVVISPP